MKKLLILGLVLLLGACASQPTSPPINMMILVQDAGIEDVPHSHRGVSRMLNRVIDDVSNQGINVYDPSYEFSELKTYSNAAIYDMAMSYSKAPIDYVAVLTVNAKENPKAYTTDIAASVYVQTIQVGSGRVVGTTTVDGSKLNVDTECDRNCLDSTLSRSLANISGDISSAILNSLPNKSVSKVTKRPVYNDVTAGDGPEASQFTLIFEGFKRDEMSDIEGYLEIFSGFESMTYTESSTQYYEISYTASISRNKLSKNLYRMLGELDTNGSVKIVGNTARVIKFKNKPSSSKYDINGWEE